MHIAKGDQFTLLLMVHNPLPPTGPGGTYENVFGQLTLSLYPDNETANLKEVKYYPAHMDQVPCETTLTSDGTPSFTFDVPANSIDYEFSATTTRNDPARFSFKKKSTIVFIGGHLHGWQGGKKLFADKNGKPFLEFTTSPSPTDPYRYDSSYYPTSLEVEAGDTISLRALYDNTENVLRRGVMGMLDVYYYEN